MGRGIRNHRTTTNRGDPQDRAWGIGPAGTWFHGRPRRRRCPKSPTRLLAQVLTDAEARAMPAACGHDAVEVRHRVLLVMMCRADCGSPLLHGAAQVGTPRQKAKRPRIAG
ncbi:MAG: hypothetical protein AMXMBFR58_06180 [Phycisphaerae bacterium]